MEILVPGLHGFFVSGYGIAESSKLKEKKAKRLKLKAESKTINDVPRSGTNDSMKLPYGDK